MRSDFAVAENAIKNYNPGMLEKFLDFLFPPTCPVCGDTVLKHGQVCMACWNKFNWIADPKCARCGYPFPANVDHDENMLCPDCMAGKSKLNWMRAACVYDDAGRGVMLPFKHGGRLEYRDMMAKAMVASLRELQNDKITELLVLPVPLANRRLFHRGYNQAALLARPVAKRLGAEIDYDSVRRKHRPDMGHMSARQRRRNIAGVFAVKNPENMRGRKILLIDDVYTTGATMEELAKVLKKAGAAWVGGLTFCRVVRAI